MSDGSTCDATKNITVYAPPNLNVSINPTSKYCLTQNYVCLDDNSTSGGGGSKNIKRTILWGDGGKTDDNNPKTGDKICYTYGKEGKFSLTVEITNDKGCEAKQELDVEVLFDFPPKFLSGLDSKDCDTQYNWFQIDTSWKKYFSDVVSATYDFADGTTHTLTSLNTNKIKHGFTKTGVYPVNLIIKLKNGCEVRYQRQVSISLDKVVINHKKLDSVKCYPGYFEFSHPNLFGASYTWSAYDTGLNFVKAFGGARNSFFFPENPGKYYIKLVIKRGQCETVLEYDSIESIGVRAGALVLNGSQCDPKDTVYVCDNSISHRAKKFSYLWTFNDVYADKCTTDSENGVNANKNCNFSLDGHAKHKYDSNICGHIRFTIKDETNGCIDSTRAPISIYIPKKEDIKFKHKKCINRAVLFEKEECLEDIQINYDSLCDRDNFDQYYSSYIYPKTCDSNGWVTVGAAVRVGNRKVYRSCDTSDYYIDESRVCIDTFWYHHAFQLIQAPYAQAIPAFEGCLPANFTGTFVVQDQPDVNKIVWDWGNGDRDTVYKSTDSSKMPSMKYAYLTSGRYEPSVVVYNKQGCESSYFMNQKEIGYYNDFRFEEPVCPGVPIQFLDTVTYWKDTIQYWRKERSPEKLIWNFSDGRGYSDTTWGPKVAFDTAGNYEVTLVTFDKRGCTDTTRKTIEVIDIYAGVKNITKKLLCDDIIQLFDSSHAVDDPRDSIVSYFWDFGDGKTPSYLKDPFHFYSSYGEFDILHVVENTIGCIDSVRTKIEINGPIPEFDILSDTVACVPHTVEFQNNSKLASDYIWYFGDTSSSSNTLSTKSDSNVSFTYTKPGTYYIYLYAGDSVVNPDNGNNVYYCNSVFPDTNAQVHPIRRVIILPIPQVDFFIDGTFCKNQTLTLIDNSDTIYKTYQWYWDQGSIVTQDPQAQFPLTDTGKITIDYRPTYTPQGPYQKQCYDSIQKDIRVFSNESDFSFTKDTVCPIFYFKAEATPSTEFMWDFGHPSSGPENLSFQKNPRHNYSGETGSFEVCLESKTVDGCLDTVCQTVESDYEFKLFIPNVITPNDDNLNDALEIEIEGEDLYELSIYNRWGELVYQGKEDRDPGSGLNWDGTEMKTGRLCPAGTYFYIFKFREACADDAKIEKYNGIITLIRDHK